MDFRCQDCSRSRVNYLSWRISHGATSCSASTSDNFLARYDTYWCEFYLKRYFYCMFQTSGHFSTGNQFFLFDFLVGTLVGGVGHGPRGRFPWNVAACEHTEPICRFRCAARAVYVLYASWNVSRPCVTVVGWEGHALSASARPAQSTHRAGLSSLDPIKI